MWREGSLDLTAPGTFREYFFRVHRLGEQDSAGVMAAESKQDFAEVAKLFQMIDQTGQAVVAPFGDEWGQRVDDIRRDGISRGRMRRLQPLMVNLYRQEIDTLVSSGALERIEDTFWVVAPGFRIYDARWGFGWKGPLAYEPEDLIA